MTLIVLCLTLGLIIGLLLGLGLGYIAGIEHGRPRVPRSLDEMRPPCA